MGNIRILCRTPAFADMCMQRLQPLPLVCLSKASGNCDKCDPQILEYTSKKYTDAYFSRVNMCRRSMHGHQDIKMVTNSQQQEFVCLLCEEAQVCTDGFPPANTPSILHIH